MENESYASPIERVKEKWGTAIDKGFTGFQVIPDVLIRSQQVLGLDHGDMMVLLNILMHWWEKDNYPYPRPDAIARRMGVTRRTVERHITRLEELGLVVRMPSEEVDNGTRIRRFNLSGLLGRLEELATGMRGYERDYEAGGFKRAK